MQYFYNISFNKIDASKFQQYQPNSLVCNQCLRSLHLLFESSMKVNLKHIITQILCSGLMTGKKHDGMACIFTVGSQSHVFPLANLEK